MYFVTNINQCLESDNAPRDVNDINKFNYKSQKPLSKILKRYLSFKKNLNLINAYWNYYRRTSVISNYPIQAFIEPTTNCNLHCPACPTGLRLSDRHRGTLTLEKFKILIDEIGDYLFILHMYNWGEPTLHLKFPEMIKYASDKGIFIITSSNFSVKLSDEYVRKIVYSGLDVLLLSIDGITQETYSRYRKGGNLNIVLENLKKLHDIKIETSVKTPVIIWKFHVFKHNEHEIEDLKNIYKILGADELITTRAYVPNDSEEIQATTNPLYPPISTYKPQTKTCSQLYCTFVHNPDGLVSPCCGLSSVNLDFSIYKNGVLKTMNTNKFINARMFFKNQYKICYDKINVNDNGLRLNTNLHESGIVCLQCPTPNLQDGAMNIMPYFLGDIFVNLIKPNLSEYRQEYLRTKWLHWKTMTTNINKIIK